MDGKISTSDKRILFTCSAQKSEKCVIIENGQRPCILCSSDDDSSVKVRTRFQIFEHVQECNKHYLDNKELDGALLTNRSKAFDCLSRNLLLCKMHAYGSVSLPVNG